MKFSLHAFPSIFTAKTKAIQLAFEYIRYSINKHLTIFSYSLSCLQSIRNMNIDRPYILDIEKTYYLLTKQNEIVDFCWIPCYIGIPGNTKADRAAKDALSYDIALFRIPYVHWIHFNKSICKLSLAKLLGFPWHK
jgi:hypothetical protein